MNTLEITTTTNKEQRSIRSKVMLDDEGRSLELSVSHYAERKVYYVSIYRPQIREGIASYSLMEDSKRIAEIPTARYSVKKLAEIHADYVDIMNDTGTLEWARASKIRK